MVYDPGALHAALSAAVGDDPQLIAELRGAFLESANGLVVQLHDSALESDWIMAALRLQGVAASFGAVQLMSLAETAAAGAVGDKAILAQIREAIAAFDS